MRRISTAKLNKPQPKAVWRITLFKLFALAPFAAHGAIEPGSYLFLYGQLVGCGERTYLVDYAEVAGTGEVEFFHGLKINVFRLSEDEVVPRLAKKIGEKTGHTPETLSIRVVSSADLELIATELIKLAFGPPVCSRRVEPSSPSPGIDDIRSLAQTPSTSPFGRLQPA